MRLQAFSCGRVKTLRNDDRFRVDGDKNIRLLAFAFTIVFVWTGPKITHINAHLITLPSDEENGTMLLKGLKNGICKTE